MEYAIALIFINKTRPQQATVDKNSVSIKRANYAFRTVYVPAGKHTVQFVFNPGIWKVRLLVSGATLLALLVWAVWKRK